MIIVWRITERCNLSCPFCRYDRRLRWVRRDMPTQKVLAFGKILSDYQHQTKDRVLVSWLGGEPFLWKPLLRVSKIFRENLRLNVSVTTNGSLLLHRHIRLQSFDALSEITISVDGFAEFHNVKRGFKNGFQHLKRCVQWMSRRKNRIGSGPKLRANILLMRENIGDFAPLCCELAAWGIEEITFNQLGGNDRPDYFISHRLLPHQIEKLKLELPFIRTQLWSAGVRLQGGPAYIRRMEASASDQRIGIHDCEPGERFLFINERGYASPCSFTINEYGVPIDEIYSVNDLFNIRGRFQTLRIMKKAGSCDDCHSTQVFEKFVNS